MNAGYITRMRTRFKWLLVIVLVIGGLAAAIWYGFNAFATDEVRRFLAERDIPVQRLTIESITTKHIVLKDVSIGENGAVQAAAVTLTRLSGNNLNTMQVHLEGSGIELRGENTKDGWSFGGVERLFPKTENKETPKEITKASVHLSGVSIDAQGALTGDIKGTLNAGGMEYKNENDLLELSKVTLKPSLNSNARQVTVPFTIGSASFSRTEGKVFTPLSLSGTAHYALEANQLKSDFSGLDGTKKFKLTGTINHNVATGNGKVTIKTNDVALGDAGGRLKFAQLLPTMDATRPTPTMRGQLASTITLGKEGYESVNGVLDIFSLEPGVLLADALGKNGTLDGKLKAKLPFNVTPKGWKISNGDVKNDGPMKLSMLQEKEQQVVSGLAGLLGKSIPQGALDTVNISSLDLNANSTDDQGEMVLKGKLQGNNPMLKRDVIININLSTNLMSMLKSLAATQIQPR